MSEMVERMAAAIDPIAFDHRVWTADQTEERIERINDALDDARAALQALLEPTPEMGDAFITLHSPGGGMPKRGLWPHSPEYYVEMHFNYEGFRECFKAMIQSALTDSTEGQPSAIGQCYVADGVSGPFRRTD